MAARRVWRRFLRVLIAALVVWYVAWCAVLYVLQGPMLFPRALAGPGGPPPPEAAAWFLERPGGVRVECRLFRGEAHDDSPPPSTVVFFHGNAELIDHAGDLVTEYRRRGLSVLLVEYRGYGRSTGTPAQGDLTADALAAIDDAAARHAIDPSRLIYHGRSVGGGIAAQVAARRPPAALILQSTFTSVASFAWGMGAPPFLVSNPFRTDRVLPGLACPVLIMHGDRDTIIPTAHGRRLAALREGITYVELAGDHNDFPADPRAYWNAIDEFLARVMP
jgi:fermentation-respiration switch protein FrsA (DUF1100 family)